MEENNFEKDEYEIKENNITTVENNYEEENKNVKKNKKSIIEKPIFWIIIGLIVSAIVGRILYSKSGAEIINGEKIYPRSVDLAISKDHKYFNNRIEDFAAVLISDFDNNGLYVSNHLSCSSNEFDYKYCYEIILDNDEIIYLLGNDTDKFEKIIYDGDLTGEDYIGKVLGTIVRLYIANLDDKKIDEMNQMFLSNDNLERSRGISYVNSYVKFEWYRDNEKNTYRIVISVVEYENQDQYKKSKEYKDEYNETQKTSAYGEVQKQISSNQTIDSYDINGDTGLVDVKIKYEKSDLSKYMCATDTQSIAKKLVGSKTIGSIQTECINNGTIFYVKVENINSITADSIDSNTKYFDANYNQENTNLENLKALYASEYKNSCATYSFKDVLRTPSEYTGKRAYWFGEILQVIDSSYSSFKSYRVGVSCTKYQYIDGYSCPDTIYVTYFGDGNFIEDDMVKIYGTMNGTQTYTTVLGASVTIPKVSAQYIDLQ